MVEDSKRLKATGAVTSRDVAQTASAPLPDSPPAERPATGAAAPGEGATATTLNANAGPLDPSVGPAPVRRVGRRRAAGPLAQHCCCSE